MRTEADMRTVLHDRDATVRGYSQVDICVMTQNDVFSSYWHLGKTFVKTHGYFLELLEEIGTY